MVGSDKITVKLPLKDRKTRTLTWKVVTIKDNEGHFYIAGQTGKE
jgi:hypothetical protein